MARRITSAREQAEMLLPWRAAELIKEKIPADRNWLEHDSPFREYDDYPSEPVSYAEHDDSPSGDWYHVAPQSLKPGTKLIPGGGSGLHDTAPDDWKNDSGMGNRRNHVWIAPNIDKALFWQSQFGEGARIHHVKPGAKPQPWNMTGSEGFVVPHAHVLQDVTDDPELHKAIQDHTLPYAPPKRIAAGQPWLPHKLNPDPTNPYDDEHYNPDRPPLSRTMVKPDQDVLPPDGGRWPVKESDAPLFRGMHIDLDHPAHADHPNVKGMKQILYGEHPDAGLFDAPKTPGNLYPHPESPEGQALSNHLLDFMEDTGQRRPQGIQFTKDHTNAPTTWLGRHWTSDPKFAEEFSSEGWDHVPRGMSVLMRADWDGRGEDLGRANSGGSFPGENEVTLSPGAQLNVSELNIRHPQPKNPGEPDRHNHDWHNVLHQPQVRTARA